MATMNRRSALTALAASPIALSQVLSAAEKSGVATDLTMLVMEKQKDIQVLKAMGSSAFRIQKIFILVSHEYLKQILCIRNIKFQIIHLFLFCQILKF